MPSRLVNSQGRKYWLPFLCAISPLLLLPFRTAVVELRCRCLAGFGNSGVLVGGREEGREGGSVAGGGGGGGCGGSSEGKKEDLGVKSLLKTL